MDTYIRLVYYLLAKLPASMHTTRGIRWRSDDTMHTRVVCILLLEYAYSSTTRRLHPVHTDLCQQESLSSGNIGRVGGWVLLQYF